MRLTTAVCSHITGRNEPPPLVGRRRQAEGAAARSVVSLLGLSIAWADGKIRGMRERSVVSASILAADFTRLGSAIQAAETGGADWIHVDVMDGHFVPALTMGPVVVAACRRATRLPLDVHLMVERPEHLLQAFAEAGADSLTVHVEACPQLHRTLETIRGLGMKAGA